MVSFTFSVPLSFNQTTWIHHLWNHRSAISLTKNATSLYHCMQHLEQWHPFKFFTNNVHFLMIHRNMMLPCHAILWPIFTIYTSVLILVYSLLCKNYLSNICLLHKTWFLHFFKGGAGRETVLLIFQPSHFIVYLLWSEWKIWRKNQKHVFSRGWFPWKWWPYSI